MWVISMGDCISEDVRRERKNGTSKNRENFEKMDKKGSQIPKS